MNEIFFQANALSAWYDAIQAKLAGLSPTVPDRRFPRSLTWNRRY